MQSPKLGRVQAALATAGSSPLTGDRYGLKGLESRSRLCVGQSCSVMSSAGLHVGPRGEVAHGSSAEMADHLPTGAGLAGKAGTSHHIQEKSFP